MSEKSCIYIYIHINNFIDNNFKIEFFKSSAVCSHCTTMYGVHYFARKLYSVQLTKVVDVYFFSNFINK